jgi:Winged helix DNA-binding domain
MTRLREVALLRLVAQRLAGPASATPGDAVRGMLALQGQDWPGVRLSVALRTAGGTRDAVLAAVQDGELVRTWPFRGTLHLVAAEDVRWLLDLTAPRGLVTIGPRLRALGLDEATLERARGLVTGALAGGGRLRRDALLALLREGGLDTADQRGAHVVIHLCLTGVLCLGPVDGAHQQFVLMDEWVAPGRSREREEALGELALRYFASHGPASAEDLARWTGLLKGDVRTAVALARPQLEPIAVDGVEQLMDPGTPERLAASRAQAAGVHLLPGFDELLLGYRDRSATLDEALAAQVVPGSNGMFMATVVRGGRVVGLWRRGKGAAVDVMPLTTFSPTLVAAIERRVRALP